MCCVHTVLWIDKIESKDLTLGDTHIRVTELFISVDTVNDD
jgi:hypothetical protein